jgi:hypothetical protein
MLKHGSRDSACGNRERLKGHFGRFRTLLNLFCHFFPLISFVFNWGEFLMWLTVDFFLGLRENKGVWGLAGYRTGF